MVRYAQSPVPEPDQGLAAMPIEITVSGAEVANLDPSDPVVISLPPDGGWDGGELACGAWDGTGWSAAGCRVRSSPSNATETLDCECTHLTLFAVWNAFYVTLACSNLQILSRIRSIGPTKPGNPHLLNFSIPR